MAMSTPSVTSLRIPALSVHVTCTSPKLAMSTAAASHRQTALSLTMQTATQTPTQLPLPADTVLASVLHPSTQSSFTASKQEDGVWTLGSREVILDRNPTHPLALIVPGFRLKFLAGASTGSRGYSHLLSCSVPLTAAFKDIHQKNIFTMQRATCEDGMVYTISLGLDTRGLSLASVQRAAADLQQSVDALMHHETVVARSLGMPALRTVEELVSEVDVQKQRRSTAVAHVLKALSADQDSTAMLDLQYGRAFGMRVDQQQCRALREGAIMGHGFDQTLLNATIAQTSFLVKIAQAAGVDIHDAAGVRRSVEEYVHTQGADALAHGVYEHMQNIHNSRTTYGLDPAFGVAMSIMKAVQMPDGSVTMNVLPHLMLQSNPGEDQNLTPGTEYSDVLGFATTDGLLIRDCEDGAHAINAVGDLFRCVPSEHLLTSQKQLLQHMPADMQMHESTLLFMTGLLAQSAASAEALTTKAFKDNQTLLSTVTSHSVTALASKSAATARTLFATSLLASSPQLDTTLRASAAEPASKLRCSAEEYHAWWTAALSSQNTNLNGHSVAVSAAMAPLLSINVQGTRVDLHMLDQSLRVYESTAPARQIYHADTASVKLNLSTAAVTPARRTLQQRLDQCGPLTLCMACNVRSSLHAQETITAAEQLLHRAAQNITATALQGNALAAAQMPKGPSIVPMQTFSLQVEANTQDELTRQMAFTFYKTLLSCGAGLVFTLDKKGAYAGMSMSRKLPDTQAFVAGSPIEGVELRNLRALGALQSSFVLTASEALTSMPPLMPLALQQRMRMCPVRQQLVPLTHTELKLAKHACGMLAQTAMLSVSDAGVLRNNVFAAPTASVDRAAANMLALYTAASKVVGQDVHVTGGPFAETLLLTFA